MAQTDYQNQIDYLKEQFLEDNLDDDGKISIIDLLSEYNHEGITAIKDLLSNPLLQNDKIKKYALKIIKKSKT
ncbi:MAG: hypothetical protein ACTHJ7_06145 [Candidatus Nitrosocosmicus sp.]